jgi:hypothetical protein
VKPNKSVRTIEFQTTANRQIFWNPTVRKSLNLDRADRPAFDTKDFRRNSSKTLELNWNKMFETLPEEIVHLILWYYTNIFQGLICFRCICKDWKSAAETSEIWLLCDLTFYCPKEYLLLRKNDFKIINDSMMLRLFIESSNFVASCVYHINLFQAISFKECLKVSCDKSILTFKKDSRNRKVVANEICKWFLKLLGGYSYWWDRCIYWRKVIGFCYHFLNSNYIPIVLPVLLFLSIAIFGGSIFYLNDLSDNLFSTSSQSISGQSNLTGVYLYYIILGIYFILFLLKELWKYLHDLEFQNKIPAGNPFAGGVNLPLIISNSSKNCDDIILGFFGIILVTVLLLHYQIKYYSNELHSLNPYGMETFSTSFFPSLYWSYSLTPFWIWYLISLSLIAKRWTEFPWSFYSSIFFFSIFITLFGITATTAFLSLDQIIGDQWMEYVIFLYLILNLFLALLLISFVKYFQLMKKEFSEYFVFYSFYFFPSIDSNSTNSDIASISLHKRIHYYSLILYYYFPTHLCQKYVLFLLLVGFISVMIASSSILVMRYFFSWVENALLLLPLLNCMKDISSLSWFLLYLLGFHGLIVTKLLEEIRNRFQIND